MQIRSYLFSVVLLSATLTGCKQTTSNPGAIQCRPPARLLAQAPCESGYPGVLLIASDYDESSFTSFIFEIFPQKDTLSNDLTVRAYKNGANTHERFLVGANVLNDSPKFLVQVTLNCGMGKEVKSAYFSFVKRPSANPACFVWGRQTQ